MDRDKLELLAAAAVDLVAASDESEYKGSIDAIFDRLRERWAGNFTRDELRSALGLLTSTTGSFLKDEEMTRKFVRISPEKFQKYFEMHDTGSAERMYPMLYLYNQFGSDWLRGTWGSLISPDSPPVDEFADIKPDDHAKEDAQLILSEIEDALLHGNEAGVAFGDDREAVAAEVGLLRMAISKSKIRVHAVKEMAIRTLGYIAEKASGAAIADLAKKALQYILEWLT